MQVVFCQFLQVVKLSCFAIICHKSRQCTKTFYIFCPCMIHKKVRQNVKQTLHIEKSYQQFYPHVDNLSTIFSTLIQIVIHNKQPTYTHKKQVIHITKSVHHKQFSKMYTTQQKHPFYSTRHFYTLQPTNSTLHHIKNSIQVKKLSTITQRFLVQYLQHNQPKLYNINKKRASNTTTTPKLSTSIQ